ncbi:MAG TPA: PorP/SprF family type IX secretion system membrane protein [Flavobacteriales bacterium]|nr:PorP/SprF family type IX secretion system membrane protein [Flavobacteriales bacterium]
MMRKLIVSILIAFNCAFVHAQDMQFSQYFQAPMYLNPAFAGANVCARVSSNFRVQWPSISNGYSSQILALDHFYPNINMGAGLMFTNDVAGTGRLRTTTGAAVGAYNFQVNRTLAFRFGLQAGFFQRSVDFNALTFGDQLARGGAPTSIEAAPRSVIAPDFATGFLAYSGMWWGGIALHHLNRPDEALMSFNAFRPLKFSLHGGKSWYMKKESDYDKNSKQISFTFNYRSQLKYDQLDLGTYYSKGPLNIGLWYRGIPIFKSYKKGYPNNDAVCVIIGMTKDRFKMGYSYDHTISWLRGTTGGAHEFSLSYQMCKQKKRKKYSVVICPKF